MTQAFDLPCHGRAGGIHFWAIGEKTPCAECQYCGVMLSENMTMRLLIRLDRAYSQVAQQYP
jgi:hypothetical protein